MQEPVQLTHPRNFRDLILNLVSETFSQLERKADVLLDSHVGIEGIVLKDHRHVALERAKLIDDPVIDANFTRCDIFQSSRQIQQGGLAAPRRTE